MHRKNVSLDDYQAQFDEALKMLNEGDVNRAEEIFNDILQDNVCEAYFRNWHEETFKKQPLFQVFRKYLVLIDLFISFAKANLVCADKAADEDAKIPLQKRASKFFAAAIMIGKNKAAVIIPYLHVICLNFLALDKMANARYCLSNKKFKELWDPTVLVQAKQELKQKEKQLFNLYLSSLRKGEYDLARDYIDILYPELSNPKYYSVNRVFYHAQIDYREGFKSTPINEGALNKASHGFNQVIKNCPHPANDKQHLMFINCLYNDAHIALQLNNIERAKESAARLIDLYGKSNDFGKHKLVRGASDLIEMAVLKAKEESKPDGNATAPLRSKFTMWKSVGCAEIPTGLAPIDIGNTNKMK